MSVDLNLLDDLKKLPYFVDVYKIKYSKEHLVTYGLNGCFSVFIFNKDLNLGYLAHFPPFMFTRFKNEFLDLFEITSSYNFYCILLINQGDKGGSLPIYLNDFLNNLLNNKNLTIDIFYYNSDKIGFVEFNLNEHFFNSSQFNKISFN